MDKVCEFVYRKSNNAVGHFDFINTDAHKFGVLLTSEDGDLEEQIAKSTFQIQKLRKKYGKNTK